MKVEMKLQEAPFRAIERGEKKIERRLYDEKRQQLQVGDVIEFSLFDNPSEKLVRTIFGLHIFATFADLYQKFPWDGQPSDMYEYYSPADEVKYGVVAIELE